MTDLEAFIELYRRFGIECVVNQYPWGSRIVLGEPLAAHQADTVTTHDKLDGYYGFYSTVEFDANGAFIG